MANLVLFAMAREAAHQKSLSGVTRKAFLVSNNGRIYVSHAAEKEPQVNYRKMKDLLQMMEKTLGPQGLAPSLKTLAIILDFSRNVKRKNA